MMGMSPMNFQNHLQRHQDLIRERANDRLANQVMADRQIKIVAIIKTLLNSVVYRVRQQFTRPAHQPCPQTILRESDI